jgi:hypothetical protein
MGRIMLLAFLALQVLATGRPADPVAFFRSGQGAAEDHRLW